MCPAVHQPGDVQRDDVPEDHYAAEGVAPAFAPTVDGGSRRQVRPDEQHQGNVEAPLEHHNWIRQQVAQVHGAALANYLGVFADEQPSLFVNWEKLNIKMVKFFKFFFTFFISSYHMTEEEAPRGVVRIGVSVRPLVVHPVVADPLVEVVLQRQHVQHGEKEAEGKVGLVAPVGPESEIEKS